MRSRLVWLVGGFACVLVACGGDPDGMPIDGPYATMEIGPAGGTLAVPRGEGPTLTIPNGALATTTTITILKATDPKPDDAATDVWQFLPEGLVFAKPATVSFPVADATGPLSVRWSDAGVEGYEERKSTQTATSVSAPVEHVSIGWVAPTLPAVAMGDHHTFVLSRVLVPTTNTQAREYGLDLNGDKTIDNQLGLVFATLASMGNLVQANTDNAIDRGLALVLADLQTTDFQTGSSAGFKTFLGATPSPAPCTDGSDAECRHHLAGTGAFSVASTSPMNGYLVGDTVSGTLVTDSAGHAVIQMALNENRAMTVHLIGARAKITGASAAGITTGYLAGALTEAEVDTVVIPELVYSANFAVQRDCHMLSSPPSCGCDADSEGKTQLGLFDTVKDCSISESEIANNSLIVSLLAPDVTVEGQTALSLGLGFAAVPGAFTP